MEKEENPDQKALRKWLFAGLMIPEVTQLRGDAGYLLNNMIAKYTLAADSYVVSEKALYEFGRKGVDLSQIYSRQVFYGKQGGDNPFIYEHTIPAGIIRKELLSCIGNTQKSQEILFNCGEVAVILRSENDALRSAGLSSKMPNGWSFGDNPLLRYHQVGITMSNAKLKVSGAICR